MLIVLNELLELESFRVGMRIPPIPEHMRLDYANCGGAARDYYGSADACLDGNTIAHHSHRHSQKQGSGDELMRTCEWSSEDVPQILIDGNVITLWGT